MTWGYAQPLVIEEAAAAGTRRSASNKELGIDDPNTSALVLEVLTSERFRRAFPRQIVPKLADEGVYAASNGDRRTTAPPELVATAASTVWLWDIKYP